MSCTGRYTGIIQRLINEGVVVVYFDPRSGSWDDLSGNGNDVIPTAPTTISSRGARLNLTGRMDIAADTSNDLSSFDESACIIYFPDGYKEFIGAVNYIWSQGSGFYFGGQGGSEWFLMKIGSDTAIGSGADVKNSNYVAYSHQSGSAPVFYKNGVFHSTGSLVLTKQAPTGSGVSIGSVLTSYIRQIPSTFGAVLATNRALTADEHYQVYEELQAMTWPNKTWSRNMGQVCINPDATGLVAAYDMHPCDGVVKDLSGNGNDGTINGPVFEYTEIGGSMKFPGAVGKNIVVPYDSSMDITDDFSANFWIKAGAVSETIMSRWKTTSNNLCFGVYLNSAGVLRFAGSSDGTSVSVSTATSVITDNLWRMVSVVYTKADNTVRFYLNDDLDAAVLTTLTSGLYGSSDADLHFADEEAGNLGDDFSGSLSKPKIFNRALSQSEITALYNCGASAVNFKTDYGVCESVAAETSGELSNSPFRIESGSFKISTDTIGGDTCKVIECVTAGVCQVPTAYFHGDETGAAYGSWEFWVLKPFTGNGPRFFYTATNAGPTTDPGFSGYEIRIDSVNSVRAVKTVSGTPTAQYFTSGSGSLTTGSWNKFKITRNSAGTSNTYLNGVLIPIIAGSGGSGANPFTDAALTTSKHIVLDLDAGDKVAYAAPNGDCSIVKYQGVV